MAQMQLLQQSLNKNDVVYTPDWCAIDLVSWFSPSGRILEPCMGDGAIYRHLPAGSDWCEIDKGRDFFAWTTKEDWIISNPPFSMFKEFLRHSYDIAVNIVYLVPTHNFFRSGGLMKMAKEFGWCKHVRFYGAGHKLGFPMGNPIAAFHFVKGYQSDTSWSWYEPISGVSSISMP